MPDRAEAESEETRLAATEQLIASARDLREQFRQDWHRPRYHFLPPAGWMNDLNGPLFWKGRYHIFYQANPDAAYPHRMRWGHASSADLVHWVHHPIALSPTPGGADREACFSGGAVINDGVPTLIYHGVPDGTCLATSTDDDLIEWTKHPANPVIRVPAPGDPEHGRYAVYDPCAWRRGDTWYALCGGRDETGDTAYLFKSPDMVHWTYLRPFYQSDRRWTELAEDCAVPDFFPLGNKHMLLFCSHLQCTQYYLGSYRGDHFRPQTHARMSWAGGLLGGGITMRDGKGRRLYFDWIREARTETAQRLSGWSGVMTLPRVLTLPRDGILRITPVPELTILRRDHHHLEGITLGGDSEIVLDDIAGPCLELALTLEPGSAREFGLKVACAPDGSEQTAISCEPGAEALRVDTSASTLDASIQYTHYRNPAALAQLPEAERIVHTQTTPFALAPGEPLHLRVFLDHSVLEVFANGRQALTHRIYPTRRDSVGVRLFARGGSARVTVLDAWDMAPAH